LHILEAARWQISSDGRRRMTIERTGELAFQSRGNSKTMMSHAIGSRVAIDRPLIPTVISADRGSAAADQAERLRARFGTQARNRRGLSTMIVCSTSSLTPAAFSLGRNTVSVFPYPLDASDANSR